MTPENPTPAHERGDRDGVAGEVQTTETVAVPDHEKRAVRTALSDHFVMWTPLGDPTGPAGDWVCQCGLKFGFSDTAIDHVAEAVEKVIGRREALARYFAFWHFFLRLPSPTPLSDTVQREAMRLRDLVPHNHEQQCCREHGTHSMPHVGCILR